MRAATWPRSCARVELFGLGTSKSTLACSPSGNAPTRRRSSPRGLPHLPQFAGQAARPEADRLGPEGRVCQPGVDEVDSRMGCGRQRGHEAARESSCSGWGRVSRPSRARRAATRQRGAEARPAASLICRSSPVKPRGRKRTVTAQKVEFVNQELTKSTLAWDAGGNVATKLRESRVVRAGDE